MNPTYLFYGKELNKREARHLAADLLAFAGPERRREFHAKDRFGDRFRVTETSSAPSSVLVSCGELPGVGLTGPQIDALIDWLKGHREDNPA